MKMDCLFLRNALSDGKPTIRLYDSDWYYIDISSDCLRMARGIGSRDSGMDIDHMGRLILEKECDII
jgi:hypothetical protein